MDPRIPLPNSIRCPALALFRKYNYPDAKMLEAFQDETTKEHLKKISQVTIEIKDDGTIQEYGRNVEPEHIHRRIRSGNGASEPHISRDSARAEQEGKDAGTGVEAREGGGARDQENSAPGGGVQGTTEPKTK